MTDPAFDGKPGSPYEASPFARERRAEGHHVPPGPTRRFFGWDVGWWGRG